jgi:Growth-Arrest-Specific Protein 2 Domain
MAEQIFDNRLLPAIILPPPSPEKVPRSPSPRNRLSPTRPTKATSSVPYQQYRALLTDSTLSISQKDLLTRVVDAADKIRAWCDTIERWRWSGSFNVPSNNENGAHLDGTDSDGGELEHDDNVEFWGCLPSIVVEKYELELDTIHTDLQQLDVDDMKERILSIHQGNSRPSSSASTFSVSRLVFLDDFSFVVTKSLLKLLPDLAKLNRYMKLWSTRLAILHIVPQFLNQYKLAQTNLQASWRGLDTEVTEDGLAIDEEQTRLDKLKESSQRSISEAGQSLDTMLDLLEGHDDVLPDHWIDDFEAAESDIGTWSLAAEKKIFDLRTRRKASIPEVAKEPEPDSSSTAIHQVEEPVVNKDEAVVPVIGPESGEKKENLQSEEPSDNSTSNSIPLTEPQISHNCDAVSTEHTTHDYTSKAINEKPNAMEETSNLVHLESLLEPVKEATSISQSQSADASDLPSLSLSQLEPSNYLQPSNRNSTSTVSEDQPSHSKLSSSLPSPTTPGAQDAYLTEPSSPPEPEVEDISTTTANLGRNTNLILDHNSGLLSTKHREASEEVLDYNPVVEDDNGKESIVREVIFNDATIGDDKVEDATIEDTIIRHDLKSAGAQTPTRSTSDQDLSMLSAMSGTSFIYNSDDEFDNDEIDDSPSRRVAQLPKPPLNAMMKKRRDKTTLPTIVTIADESAPAEPPSPNTAIPTIEDTSPLLSPVSPKLPLQEQISSILDAIPTPIRLRSGPAANAPDVKRHRARTPSFTQGKRPTTHPHQPTLTLAPADDGGPRRANSKEPDIRLYHLIQTGRDKPIKLFIRRVGENGERVMVRVGGGWADLAEYLRIYTEHHGRRTTSDGRVEIQPIANTSNTSNTTTPINMPPSRRGSLLGSTTITPTTQPERPDSALSNTPQLPTPLDNNTPRTQPSAAATEAGASSPSSSSRRVTTWGEAGLAGPFAKRAEVTGERKEWIDSVVEQVRLGSKVEVGELGRTAATRRIFFKGRAVTPTSAPGGGTRPRSGSSRAGTPTAGRAGSRAGSRAGTPNGGEE